MNLLAATEEYNLKEFKNLELVWHVNILQSDKSSSLQNIKRMNKRPKSILSDIHLDYIPSFNIKKSGKRAQYKLFI